VCKVTPVKWDKIEAISGSTGLGLLTSLMLLEINLQQLMSHQP
jgi:hypothetical protein